MDYVYAAAHNTSILYYAAMHIFLDMVIRAH
ncbi:hypothetical protein CHELA41_24501 [Hyphomicrobiales bacterium]|nr:hypothetical protein CHELA41_24501 [Hyphomicrobiales bacterium]